VRGVACYTDSGHAKYVAGHKKSPEPFSNTGCCKGSGEIARRAGAYYLPLLIFLRVAVAIAVSGKT